jgi:predicted RNase H-like HicB family nuclease
MIITRIKIIIEQHLDGFIAYPLGIKGAIVGQGDTYEEAMADVESAIQTHLEVFGTEMIEDEFPLLEAYVAEMVVTL